MSEPEEAAAPPKRRGRTPGQTFTPKWKRWPFALAPEELLVMRQDQFDYFKEILEKKWAKVLQARDASAGLTD